MVCFFCVKKKERKTLELGKREGRRSCWERKERGLECWEGEKKTSRGRAGKPREKKQGGVLGEEEFLPHLNFSQETQFSFGGGEIRKKRHKGGDEKNPNEKKGKKKEEIPKKGWGGGGGTERGEGGETEGKF